MSEVLPTQEALRAIELTLPPNCFTVRQGGSFEIGIISSLDHGPDPKKQWHPYIKVGSRKVVSDERFWFISHTDGAKPIVRRAELLLCHPAGGQKFYLLRNPREKTLAESFVRVHLGSLALERALTGVFGTGRIIANDGDDYLVHLANGEVVRFLFPNGEVHEFLQRGKKLVKQEISLFRIIELRIIDAWERLRAAKKLPNEEYKKNVILRILQGMLYVFKRTRVYSNGRSLRVVLLQEFFLRLSVAKYSSVRSELERILKEIDPKLIPMLNSPVFRPHPEVLPLGSEKANESC